MGIHRLRMPLGRNKPNQKGHAIILFILMVPILFGIFVLAIEGTCALMNKARTEDATEAAALAIASLNEVDAQSGENNEALVTDYLNAYFDDIDEISNVSVLRLECEDNPECLAGLAAGEDRYFDYDVDVTVRWESWFTGDLSFGENFSALGGTIATKKQSDGIDVMFVTDFSGSMYESWSGGSEKYLDVISIIGEITDRLKVVNERSTGELSTVGVVPYNSNTMTTYRSNPNASDNAYDNANSNAQGLYETCWMRHEENYESGGQQWVDVDLTLTNLYAEKGEEYCGLKHDGYSGEDTEHIQDIELTTDFDSLTATLATFHPGGSTASYQGLIRGAQLLAKGDNVKRLMILLSDGVDYYYGAISPYGRTEYETANLLVNGGMCDTIREGLAGYTTSGRPIQLTLAVIGFDYDPSTNPALTNCVGSENVYVAYSTDQRYDLIVDLISEEMGRLK